MNKKYLPYIIGAVVLLLVLAGGAFAYTKMTAKPDQTAGDNQPKKKRSVDPVNVIAVADRPYIQIAPVADGRHLNLVVKHLNKPATEVEYELEYQTGSLLQGAFDVLKLDSIPAVKEILLGSCSAGGACTYHSDIKGGTLLTRFQGPENYALKSDWVYLDNRAKEGEVSSKDGKFTLTSADLKNMRYVIVFNTAGYPAGLQGTPVSDPISLAVSSNLKGTGEVTIEANEAGEHTIMGWDGSKWTEMDTTVEGTKATAKGNLMELYIAVKK
ncbi:MAG TPA: hypothetical protein VD999_05515 [Vitreimonas sp.]|nr:hypothetical protein [Vitreimonas sp.]